MFCGRCPEALVCSFDDIFDQRSTFLLGFTSSNAHSAEVNKFSLMKKGKISIIIFVFSLDLKNIVMIIFTICFNSYLHNFSELLYSCSVHVNTL